MLDLFNLPIKSDARITSFYGRPVGIGEPVVWQTYQKPRGATMLYVLCIGGGAGGGGGTTGVAGSARGGGGGGGSGGQVIGLFPLNLLPDTLYVQPGASGRGGAPANGGTGGALSFVTVYPNTTATNTLLVSSAGSPGGGGNGSTTAGGAGGGAATVATIASMPLAGLGMWSALAGQAGTAGGAHTGAVGVALALPTTGIGVMGGTGGAGTTSADFAGGEITAVASSLISESRPQSATAGSVNGSVGYKLKDLMFNYPGMGGGASNTGVGGFGGHGGYGSGGGGGGGGTTGGTGGNGGPGIVVMIAW